MTGRGSEAPTGRGGSDTDVIVVGGGPVGVTAALLAAKRGLSVRLFEKSVEVYGLPRAVGMDAEIQRVFQNAGLADEIASLTTPIEGAEFVDVDGNRIIGHDLPADAVYPLGHHPSAMFHQPWLEDMLRSAATEAGVRLHLGVEVTAVDHDDCSVTVTTAGGTSSATWLIAADGAASPIRKSLGVDFVDQGFDQEWLVFDVALRSNAETGRRIAQQVCDPARPVTVVPGHANFWRWELQLQPGESAAEITRPERVWELIARWLEPEEGDLQRAVVYRFHATVADRMRVGPVFLAGDAAHQMPPFLGQGMCAGIRDAANLIWKLDLVKRAAAGPSLLDSYDAERRPHAAAVVRHAVDTGRLIDQLAGREDSGVGMDAGYGGGREFPFLQDGLLVGDHQRVGKPLLQPIVDGRLFDERLGDDFTVLVRNLAAVPAEVMSSISALPAIVVEAPAGHFDREVPNHGGAIVRPDRYVAAVADNWAELSAAAGAILSGLGPGRTSGNTAG